MTACHATVALDLQGRTAKAHIDKWQQYGEKMQQHGIAAAIILMGVKKGLPHGQFMPWLKQHGIAHTTAKELVRFHLDPKKLEEKQAYDRQRKTTERQEAKRRDSRPFHPSNSGDEAAQAAALTNRERLRAFINTASDPDIDRACQLLFPPT